MKFQCRLSCLVIFERRLADFCTESEGVTLHAHFNAFKAEVDPSVLQDFRTPCMGSCAALAAAFSSSCTRLQSALCSLQAAFWHCMLQYLAAMQPEHTSSSSRCPLHCAQRRPSAAHGSSPSTAAGAWLVLAVSGPLVAAVAAATGAWLLPATPRPEPLVRAPAAAQAAVLAGQAALASAAAGNLSACVMASATPALAGLLVLGCSLGVAVE